MNPALPPHVAPSPLAAVSYDSRDVRLARTLAVNTLVFGQLFYLFNSRHPRTSSLRRDTLLANRVAWGAAVVLLWLQITYVYAPFMHTLFGSAPLAPWRRSLAPSPCGTS